MYTQVYVIDSVACHLGLEAGSPDSELEAPAEECQMHMLAALRTWAGPTASLCPDFLICKHGHCHPTGIIGTVRGSGG